MRERSILEGRPSSLVAVEKRFRQIGARAHYLYHTSDGGGVVEKKAKIPEGGTVIMHLRHRTMFATGKTFRDESGNLCEHVHGKQTVPVQITKTTGEILPYSIYVPGRKVPK